MAFANTSGGRVILGGKDDGVLVGGTISNQLKSQLQDIAHNCESEISIKIGEFDGALIIEIQEGIDKPYKCGSGFHTRIGPNSQELIRQQIIEFLQNEGRIRYDEQLT